MKTQRTRIGGSWTENRLFREIGGLADFSTNWDIGDCCKERQIPYREAVKQQSPGSAAQRRHPGLPDESELYAKGVAPNVV
jgi:hypothetical protein